jgi:integrase
MLSNIDRGSPVGKRDYAIILLALQQGFRSSDIGSLRFNNLKWERKEIELVQQKTGKRVTHPMLPDVGWAIIDYVKHARPRTNSTLVFLPCHGGAEKLKTDGINGILTRCMRRSGIGAPRETVKGMHSLRHTLARRLMENGTSLPMVAEIMGHSSYASTSPYLRIDIEGMRSCSLSLSEVGYG